MNQEFMDEKELVISKKSTEITINDTVYEIEIFRSQEDEFWFLDLFHNEAHFSVPDEFSTEDEAYNYAIDALTQKGQELFNFSLEDSVIQLKEMADTINVAFKDGHINQELFDEYTKEAKPQFKMMIDTMKEAFKDGEISQDFCDTFTKEFKKFI